MKITTKNMKSFLDKTLKELSIGERVKFDVAKNAYWSYLNLQMKGRYFNLMAVKDARGYYLARVK